MRIYWIEEFSKGKMGTMPRPKGEEWLNSEIAFLAKEAVNLVVSLLEKEEANNLGLRHEGRFCHEHGIDFISHPIKDFSLPEDETAFFRLADLLLERIEKGENVVIHCHGGIGRSSILASSILIKSGVEKESVFDLIGQYRTIQVPDTKEQADWVLERL